MNDEPKKIKRREFMKNGSAAGAGLVLGAPAILSAAAKNAPSDELKVGFIGCGKQHEVLFNAMKDIPGLRYVAACDIMKHRVGGTAARVKSFFDYLPERYLDPEEMLSKHQDLDVVFNATPDFWHAPCTIMALEAGANVYCEKMMSNTLEGARSMVEAMDRTGKLCQIGHQRRSNPRYQFTLDYLIKGEKICGQIVNANAQWNRAVSSSQDISVKESILPDEKVLMKYGFNQGTDGKKLSLAELRHRFLNWRVYKDLSGGPISDLGAHQIDIFNWFFGTQPKSVMASGGRNYFKDREHFDNVMCVFEYDTPGGGARAFYQVLTTTSSGGGYYEAFMGTEGTVEISEREAYTNIFREGGSDRNWDELVERGILKKVAGAAAPASGGGDAIASYESAPPEEFGLPGGIGSRPPHQPHIQNFIESVRGEAKLTCDARHALESEAPIYWVNPAAENKETIVFTNEHLHV